MNTARLLIQRKPFSKLTTAEREGWGRLLATSTTSRWPFMSPTYAEAVNATVAPVDVVLCRDDHGLAAVMPLQRSSGWLGRLGLREPVGRDMTDYFGLLARPGVRLEWRQLLRASHVPCLYFTHLDESQSAYGLLGEDPTVGLRTCIPPEGGQAYWQWLKTRNKSFASQTERHERSLTTKYGPLMFEMHSSSPTPDLEFVVAFKNEQYRSTGHTNGALLNPANVRLLTRLLASNDPDCLPRLSALRCGGQLVAAHFGLQCGSLLHYWFPTYDPQFSRYSPGRILYQKMIVYGPQNGINCIDCGAGDSTAKRNFTNEEHQYFKGLVQNGTWGRVVTSMQRLRWHFGRYQRNGALIRNGK